MEPLRNIIDPPKLTGQVVMDGSEPRFRGNYSHVYRGLLKGQSVAVKVIQSTGEPHSVNRKVRRERVIWASLTHPNIHPFYGFADDPQFAPFGALVSPWCDKGDAKRFLSENGHRITENDRIELWKGVVDGVAYLHLHKPMIIHGDIKPGNVLIDDSGRPRICDFGLAWIFLEEESTGLNTTSEHTGTVRYLAPELVTSEMSPTRESDVYALGCVGLENGIPPSTSSPQSPLHIWNLLEKCWHQQPDQRPSALTVAKLAVSEKYEIPEVLRQHVMPNYSSDKTYNGPEAIVVAMDIGTTQSAVSFAYFTAGTHPLAQMVAHWPGEVDWTGGAKTPSIVSYRDGVVKACGADASRDFDEDEKNVAYWFKLHFHPAPPLISDASSSQKFEIPPLPAGIMIERVYADLMKYLMESTRRFFETTTRNGAEIWARVRDGMVIVLATPNTWDIREQATLRKAAIMGSLVTEENASQLLQFVTEAEASVHYALSHGPGKWLKRRTVFAVIDCGGSTVDTTIYRCVSINPLGLTEVCPSECVQAGGIFVNREVETMLKIKLKGSLFSSPEIIKFIVDAFERELKPMFDAAMDKYTFKFGIPTDNDPSLGIHKGKISLSNQELQPLFDVVINKIIMSCSSALIKQKTEYVLLVGGFAESPYVRRVLSKYFDDHDMQIIVVGDYTKKAAAEGAMISHIKQFVVARAARATFGGCVREIYNRNLHDERGHAVQVYADGKERVDGVFHVWIKKGTVLRGTFAHKLSYHVALDATSISQKDLSLNLKTIGIEVFAWESGPIPTWCKDEQGEVLKGMRLICTLNADLSALAGALRIATGPRGKRFYRVDYDVCVYFGGTQLRAKLQWKERGVLREGPVTVMPYVS